MAQASGTENPTIDAVAKGMPLAHSVSAKWAFAHPPSTGLPVSSDDDCGFGTGVCFYLGPLLRRFKKFPRRRPAIGYVFCSTIEQATWFGFPCDVGGYLVSLGGSTDSMRAAIARGRLGTPGDYRQYLSTLLRAGFGGDWESYLEGATPLVGGAHEEIREHIREGDPRGWTPEVRSPSNVPITREMILEILVATPDAVHDTAEFDQYRADFARLKGAIGELGIVPKVVTPFEEEKVEDALSRCSAESIRALMRGGS